MFDEDFVDKSFVEKYPWLNGGREMFEPDLSGADDDQNAANSYYSFEEFLSEKFKQYPQLEDRIIRIFILALDKVERDNTIKITEDQFNIDLYYLIKLILAAMNNRFLDNHVANFVSTMYYDKLIALSPTSGKQIEELANKMSILCVFKYTKIGAIKYPYAVDFYSYIPAASLLKDNSWAIINRYVNNGKVYLLKDSLVRLLKEKIRREVIPERVGSMEELYQTLDGVPEIHNIFRATEDKLQLIKLEQRKNRGKSKGDWDSEDQEKPDYDEYPPCVKFLLDKATNGVNLTHTERLHVSFFFANTNHSVEETVDVFRTLPDFDEDLTRYHVEFSRGLKGKGKKYSVYNCNRLRSEHLCRENDKLFGSKICSKGVKKKDGLYRLKSPLEFMFWYKVEQQREARKEQWEKSEQSRNQNGQRSGNPSNAKNNKSNNNSYRQPSNKPNNKQGGN